MKSTDNLTDIKTRKKFENRFSSLIVAKSGSRPIEAAYVTKHPETIEEIPQENRVLV